MLKNRIFFKSFYIFQIIFVLFIITSCKNFLNAGKVSDEIKDSIAYNNAKTVNIVISCKEDMGTIYPQQSYNAKLGYDFEIQFIINSDNYVIKNPDSVFEAVSKYDNTVSRADCVEFTPVERTIEDIKLGLYKAKARITKDNNDIMIRPVCTTLPSVVDIYPPFVPSGYAQDTTIKITFSKPMNPESFGNFECIFITSETGPVKTNYDTPYFSSDYTVLNIPLAKGKRLIPKDTTETKQITLTISTADLKDDENLSLSKDINYTFCVNQEIDKKLPEIDSANLYKSENSVINSLDFANWGDNDSILSQNHLKNSFSFSVQGYDDDSGVGGLRITETLYRLPNGDEITNAISQTCDYEQMSLVSESSEHSVYQISGVHNIKTANDGVIKIDLQLIDKSENPSIAKTFYVIKDTQIDASMVKFEEFDAPKKYTLESENETFTMTLKEELKDYYFGNHYSNYNIEIKWGYKEDEITNSAQRNGLEFSFVRNTELLTYIKIFCSDEFGNQKTFSKLIPPQMKFNSNCVEKKGLNIRVSPFSYESLKQTILVNGAELLIYYIFNSSDTPVLYDIETFTYPKTSTINDEKILKYNFFYAIKYADNTYYSSPVCNNYITVNNYKGTTNTLETKSTSLSNEPAPGPEVLFLTAEPVTNSGCYRIKINTDNLNPNFTWTYIFTNTTTNKTEVFDIDTFYIRSPASYTLSLQAKDSEGIIYTKSSQTMQFENEEPITQLTLFGDTTPPTFSIYKDKNFIIVPKGVILLSKPKDDIAIYTYQDEAENTYGELTYYFLPNPGTHVCDFTYFTQQELEAYQSYAKTLKYKTDSNQLFIPFEDINEAFYTLCMVVKDKAGNSTVECMPVLYKLLKKSVLAKINKNSSSAVRTHTITTEFDSEEEAKRNCHDLLKLNGQAVVISDKISSSKNNKLDTSFNCTESLTFSKDTKIIIGVKYTDESILVADSGIYDIAYPLEGTQTNVTNKSMWECVNGYQISGQSGSYVLVHTLYSQRNLSENSETLEDAIRMWLLKGEETGIYTSTAQSFLYEMTKWDAVPKGWYYTVIVHYADGIRFMSEVKQKEY